MEVETLAASKGRMSLYKILKSNKELSDYLLETALYTEDLLYSFLETYKSVIIKPIFGPGEIIVVSENDKFKILSNEVNGLTLDKEELHQCISRHLLKHKYNIIQPSVLHSSGFLNHSSCLISLHRDSPGSKWIYTSKTDRYIKLFDKDLYKSFLNKMKYLSLQAAETLGRFFPDCCTIVLSILYDMKGSVRIQETKLHVPKSKWCQYQTLSRTPSIAPFIPKTDLLTENTFIQYLTEFKEIIVKPCVGQHGKRIVKVTMTNSDTYEIHSERNKIIKPSMNEAFHYLEKMYFANQSYLVQERVPLVELEGCPLDIRVITQKVNSVWKTTGIIAKVAGRNYFVTNVAQKLLPFEVMHQQVLKNNMNHLKHEIEKVCISASEILERNVSKTRIIGFDIGVSIHGDIWIIEGNFKPDLTMFSRLKNKEMYMKIKKIIKSQRKHKNDER